MHLNLQYVHGKLGHAILSMMQSTESLQDRLARACIYDLVPASIGNDKFPSDLREQLDFIMKSVAKVKASGDEGRILATVSQMSEEEANSLIEKILLLYDDVGEQRKQAES
jgi:hypothetical protein